MPSIDSMKNSSYLKKEDAGTGVIVTIRGLSYKNIAQEGQPEKMKWLIFFDEFQKPLASGDTQREQIATCLNSRNTDDWTGQKVVLWADPSIVLRGKVVGGLRVKPLMESNQGFQQLMAPAFPQAQVYSDPTIPDPKAPPMGSPPNFPKDDPGY